MNNRVTFIVFLVCVGAVLFLPLYSSAQVLSQLLFSPSESKDFLDIAQKEVSKLVPNSKILSYTPQEQAALTIFRGATREAILKFLPAFIGTEAIKIVIKAASLLQQFSAITIKEVLDKIEKQTIEKALEIGNAWLFQNEIKTGSGSIENTSLSTTFQYVITYQEVTNDRGNIVIEFYSPDSLVAPLARGSVGSYLGFVGDSPYVGKVAPFIIRIHTQIGEDTWGWAVNSSADTKITVEFPEKVPRLQLTKELPYPLEEQKIKLLNYWNIAKRVLEYLKSVGNETVGRAADIAHKAQEIAKGVINYTSQLIVKGGAGLVDPFSKESQQLDFIATQLNIVTEALDAKEVQAKFIPSKNEVKLNLVKDEAQPAENLVSLSFPQEELGPTPQILDSVTKELTPQVVVPEPNSKLSETKEKCEAGPTTVTVLGGVIINEVAWMGTPNSTNDEWIELYDKSSAPMNLEGWRLRDKDAQVDIVFDSSHVIAANGFFLLERTNDTTVPNFTADLIYTGALSNTNEELYLFDNHCVLRDKVVASPDWLAGDSALKKSMERNNHNLEWYTYDGQSFGSPRQTNGRDMLVGYSPLVDVTFRAGITGGGIAPVISNVQVAEQDAGVTICSQENLATSTHAPVIINEIAWMGTAISANDEWIELKNTTSSPVSLSDWQLLDKANQIQVIFASQDAVAANGFYLLERTDDVTLPNIFADKIYTGALSNTEESLRLFNASCVLVDEVLANPNWSGGDNDTKKTMERAADLAWQTYYGENGTGTPKAENSTEPTPSPPAPPSPPEEPAPSPQDTTLPQIAFSSLAAAQTNAYFSLSWTATDPAGDVSPSGLQNIFLEYSITPSATGIFVQYQNNGVWTNWQQGAAGKLTLNPETTTLNLLAQDGVSYVFQVKTKDIAGNESVASTASITVSLAKTIVINEVAWAGTKAESTDEWLELLNTTSSLVDVTGWKVVSSDSAGPEITLSGTIAAGGFYLIERTDNLATSVTAQLTASFGNGLSNTACETLYMYNAQNMVVDQTACKSDGAWPAGTASPNYISMERIVAVTTGSRVNNWASNNLITHNGRDADIKFINGTPGAKNSVSVSSTIISSLRLNEFDSVTLTKLGSPYSAVWLSVPAGKTLIIEPGVTVKFENNRGSFKVEGTLNAVGEAGNGIVLTSDNGSPWCGFIFTPTSVNSDLRYITIEDSSAGGGGCGVGSQYAIFVDGSDIILKNSTILRGNSYRKLRLKNSNSTIDTVTISGVNLNVEAAAIYIEGASAPIIRNSTFMNNSVGIYSNGTLTTPTIQNNTFTGNTYAVKLDSASAILSGNTASNNTYNGIFFGGAVFSNMTWQADAIPYIVNKFTVNAGVTLTIQEGAVIKLVNHPYTESEITVQGTLITQGTQANPVVFTAASDNTAGGSNSYTGVGATIWKRIYIAPGSAGSQLNYTTIKYGGHTYYEAALYVKQSSVQVSNLTISNSVSGQSAIYSYSGAITGSDVTLSNNTYGFNIQPGDCPALTNVTVTGGTVLHPSSRQCSF